MMTATGLDFGTGLTKLAQYRLRGQNGPGELSVGMIPTAVSFVDLSSRLPDLTDFLDYEAGPSAGASGLTRCDGFPAMLESQFPAPSFCGRTSGELSREFLRLLFDSAHVPMETSVNPAPLVVAIPPMPPYLGSVDP